MFGNMKEMLKQAQNMKSQMNEIKKELEKIEVEGSAANGSCVVRMTADMKTTQVSIDETLLSGNKDIISAANGSCVVRMTADMKTTQVSIDETLLSGNKDIIENAIKVATNGALDKAKDTASKKLKSVTGGLMDNLPGF